MKMERRTLGALEGRNGFSTRHIGPSDDEQAKMCAALGVASRQELVDRIVPESIRMRAPLALGGPTSERDAIEALRAIAAQNRVVDSAIGLGYHGTITPAVIRRNVLENPAWYTAYTPYQPEISQGRLEALVNFQTMVSDLAGMDLASASLLDEGTAAAEAMAMFHRINAKAGSTFFVDHDALPQTIAVIATRAEAIGLSVRVGDPLTADLNDCFGLLVQYPGASGAVRDLEPLVAQAHDAGTLVAVAADPLALVLLRSPGAAGADVVVGSTQRFGVPMGFGGPHAAYFACRSEHQRQLPGRLVGVSVDAEGRTAYRLALQTREQHIRREKATSNICTAQVLLAVIAGLYATYHGPEGLQQIAQRVHRLASVFAAGLRNEGVTLVHEQFFDTVLARVPGRADTVVAAALDGGVNIRRVDADTVAVAFDETSTRELVNTLWNAFGVRADIDIVDSVTTDALRDDARRTDAILTHPVFHSYRSETEMLRYLRRLADRDLALDRTMIPLGSCTMKLNATSEMEPITWPEFANLHPFAPADQTQGYRDVVRDLEAMICAVTGYDAASLQPNAGSQGEYAGLLAIRAYHRANGEAERDVCLIPSSAHGTNAASAAMVGMRVVVVTCDDQGNVDVDDLRAKAAANEGRVAACMITYPSTHGVFETRVQEVCEAVHAAGGQVYLDGANLNALVGVAQPGKFGADVSHLNLHKTFCIPHGGGGPGVGPVAVRAHLAPYLPNHPLVADAGPATGIGPISAAPWGSAGILPIPWMYTKMMGGEGLLAATEVALLNANYVASRLAPHYPVLYAGEHGLVAHECILDLRDITKASGVTAEDVAKRLMDFGFHAPTLSFPVAGTLMVEPTESESMAELDRFCDAMIAIRDEIRAVERGEISVDDSALRQAPHPAADVVADRWERAYSRESAAYPLAWVRVAKYWPPVGRIDGVYGDRNVMCSCPPLSAY
ncbi:MAG: aminomethyl-transferring glycine dehydrogenase [Acidimicrobiia bacterium]